MHRLHVLIVIASFIIALRGLQVLQLFGIIPKSSPARRVEPCLASAPHPPYVAAGHAANSGSSSSSSDLVPLVHWLASNGADIEHVNVAEFQGLRGLQVHASETFASAKQAQAQPHALATGCKAAHHARMTSSSASAHVAPNT
jgi:hypothetical protein